MELNVINGFELDNLVTTTCSFNSCILLYAGMVKLLLTALLTAKLLTPLIPFTFLPDFAILASVIAKMLLPIVFKKRW